MTEERKLYITKNWVVSIFIYYGLLFILGTFLSLSVLFKSNFWGADIFQNAIVGAASIAISASSIAYIRKLYKLCFRYSSEQEEADQLFLKQLGTIVYFVTRPIFAISFAILVVTSLKSALIISSKTGVILEDGFIYVSMITSFYIGFLSGDFIKKLEKSGAEKFGKII